MARGQTGFWMLAWVVAVLAALISGWFGLMAAAWGGVAGPPGQPPSLSALLFWSLPCLSLPNVLLFLWRQRLAVITAWVIEFAMFINLAAINLQSCMNHGCTTSNPILIVAGSLLGFGPAGIVIFLPAPCLLLANWRR